MCYELNKLFPCFMAFADGCIYASTSSSKTSEKLRLPSSHPSGRLLGKGRLTIDSMVNSSLRLVETTSDGVFFLSCSFSDLEFQLPRITRLFSYLCFSPRQNNSSFFFRNVFNGSTFHLENSCIDISFVLFGRH